MESFILRAASRFLTGLLALLSIFMLLRGHDAPGGGFVGGLLLAAAVAVRSLSHGARSARATLRIDPRTLVGVGLLVATAAGCISLAFGAPLLSPLWLGALPGVGHLGTVVLFDLGVYLVVAGTALTILLTLAEDDRA
jgi:multicomponent Na+:H+ antiporter subunit B